MCFKDQNHSRVTICFARFIQRMFVYGLVCCVGTIALTCIQQAPVDPQAALLKAAGVTLSGEARLAVGLELRREWVRGCETRAGNIIADSYAARLGAGALGFVAGGNIRDDNGLTRLGPGVVSGAQLKQVLPFNSVLHGVELTAFRLKQGLEASVGRLGTTLTASKSQDHDADGPQHSDCYFRNQSGNGRLLHFSSRLKVIIAPGNQAQQTTGSASDNSLRVITEGRRITRILIDDGTIYFNPTGQLTTGWAGGANSCLVGGTGIHAGTSFSALAACNRFVVAIPDFQAQGNDDHPSFNPALAEVGNDGSVVVLSSNLGVDTEVLLAYLQQQALESLTGATVAIDDRFGF